MAGKSGRSGPQGTAEGRIAGTNSRQRLGATVAQEMAQSFGAQKVGDLAFLRGANSASRFRSKERREFLEGSPYVGDWRDWTDPFGIPRRIDIGCIRWLRDCGRTFVEAQKVQEDGKGSPVRSLPQPDGTGESYFDVLAFFAAMWQTQDILAIPKSRRMIASWLLCEMDTWDALYHPGREIYVRCVNLGKTEKMIYRSKFIYDQHPADKVSRSCLPRLSWVTSQDKPNVHNMINRVTVHHSEHEPGAMDSFIQAMSKNDDGRGDGAARIRIDEGAEQKDLASLWAGLMGNRIGVAGDHDCGQIVLVGTPVAQSHMSRIVLDKPFDSA